MQQKRLSCWPGSSTRWRRTPSRTLTGTSSTRWSTTLNSSRSSFVSHTLTYTYVCEVCHVVRCTPQNIHTKEEKVQMYVFTEYKYVHSYIYIRFKWKMTAETQLVSINLAIYTSTMHSSEIMQFFKEQRAQCRLYITLSMGRTSLWFPIKKGLLVNLTKQHIEANKF